MATIVTRSGKGSPLTNAEVDSNFTNLNSELGSHNHDGRYIKEGGTSFSGEYPVAVRVGANNFYSDANIRFEGATSKLTVDGSVNSPIFYDSNNTAYFLNPASGGKVAGVWDFTNGTIANVNNITFNDPGPSEGLQWLGGSDWRIFESPNDLVTNAGGNLQFVTGGTRRATIDTSGSLDVTGNITNPTMWVNHSAANNNGYNENIRLFPANNNVSVIAYGATGASGVPWNSTLGYSDRFEIRQGTQWQQRSYANYVEAYGSYRAPIFYDSANTAFYWNPNEGNGHRFQTPSGFVRIGPANSSWSHFTTDRPAYWFNTEVVVETGKIGSYNEDLQLRRAQNDSHKITIGAGTTTVSQNTVVQGTVQHNGLVMTSGTNVDQLYTHTFSMTLSTSWQDVGISGSMLPTGSYIVQITDVTDVGSGGGQYYEFYTGVMSWTAGGTNDTSWDEIPLHSVGHADNDRALYLRTLRRGSSTLTLQMAGDGTNTAAYTYTIKFRRMI